MKKLADISLFESLGGCGSVSGMSVFNRYNFMEDEFLDDRDKQEIQAKRDELRKANPNISDWLLDFESGVYDDDNIYDINGMAYDESGMDGPYKIPSWAFGYMVNGDVGDLTDEEMKMCDDFIQDHGDIFDITGNEYFDYNPAFGLGCEVYDCYFPPKEEKTVSNRRVVSNKSPNKGLGRSLVRKFMPSAYKRGYWKGARTVNPESGEFTPDDLNDEIEVAKRRGWDYQEDTGVFDRYAGEDYHKPEYGDWDWNEEMDVPNIYDKVIDIFGSDANFKEFAEGYGWDKGTTIDDIHWSRLVDYAGFLMRKYRKDLVKLAGDERMQKAYKSGYAASQPPYPYPHNEPTWKEDNK